MVRTLFNIQKTISSVVAHRERDATRISAIFRPGLEIGQLTGRPDSYPAFATPLRLRGFRLIPVGSVNYAPARMDRVQIYFGQARILVLRSVAERG